MTIVPSPFVTGWCNEQPGHPAPLHHLCRHTYTTGLEKTYVCTCPCHAQEAGNAPTAASQANVEAPPVHKVQRRPVQRRQVRRI